MESPMFEQPIFHMGYNERPENARAFIDRWEVRDHGPSGLVEFNVSIRILGTNSTNNIQEMLLKINQALGAEPIPDGPKLDIKEQLYILEEQIRMLNKENLELTDTLAYYKGEPLKRMLPQRKLGT